MQIGRRALQEKQSCSNQKMSLDIAKYLWEIKSPPVENQFQGHSSLEHAWISSLKDKLLYLVPPTSKKEALCLIGLSVLSSIKNCWFCTVAIVIIIANLCRMILVPAYNRAPVIDTRTLVCLTTLTLLHKSNYFSGPHIPPSSISYQFLNSAIDNSQPKLNHQ